MSTSHDLSRATPRATTKAGAPARTRTSPTHYTDALTAIWLGALTVGTWPLLVATAGPGTPLVGLVAHVSGMLAGYGVLVLLVLMARTPRLERGVGADVLARWHAWGGKAVISLVLVHAAAATAAWADVRNINLLASAWEVLQLPGLAAATLGTILMVTVAGMSIRAARRRIRHETWHGMHLLMYVAVALGFGHQLAGPDLAGHRWLQVGWSLAYAYVFALVLQHRVLTPLRQAARHRMRVVDVRPEGPGVVSIVIEGQHLDELQAESGQFFRWRFLNPDHWLNAHPFSLSAAPTKTSLRLTVKALGDGSADLQNLPVGTWVMAEGPYGAVTASRRTKRHVLLIAGGVGITPMRALFETMPLRAGDDLLLIYRARSGAEVIFFEELEDLAALRGARIEYVIGEDPQLLAAPALRRIVPDLHERDVYLCGPPGLASAVRAALAEAGLPPEQLHEERFAF